MDSPSSPSPFVWAVQMDCGEVCDEPILATYYNSRQRLTITFCDELP